MNKLKPLICGILLLVIMTIASVVLDTIEYYCFIAGICFSQTIELAERLLKNNEHT